MGVDDMLDREGVPPLFELNPWTGQHVLSTVYTHGCWESYLSSDVHSFTQDLTTNHQDQKNVPSK